MFFGRKSHPSSVICFIFIFINTILVVSAQKKKIGIMQLILNFSGLLNAVNPVQALFCPFSYLFGFLFFYGCSSLLFCHFSFPITKTFSNPFPFIHYC